MCFDVPWKTDRYRMHTHVLYINSTSLQTKQLFSRDCIVSQLRSFLSIMGISVTGSVWSCKEHGTIARYCLEAAICHLYCPDLTRYFMQECQEPMGVGRLTIKALSGRYNAMQTAFFDRLNNEVFEDPHSFVRKILQVLFF